MANPAQPCVCSPYVNICCCGPRSGISVVQPQCQRLPDGSVVNNPAYVSTLNKSFWSYKFLTDCNSSTRAISNFVIPVCQVIVPEMVIVSEKINGCGNYVSVPFTLSKTDPNFGTAPDGFQFLKVEVNNRYDKGLCVEYRLEIIGDYPVAIEPIQVKAANTVINFNCEGCFLVPECNPQGKLTVAKECNLQIVNNQGVLNCNVMVGNIGDAPLENVQFQDTVFIPTQLTIGQITISPSTLNVNTSIPGEVIISGNLGTIEPGGVVNIAYTIPISNVTTPGIYNINNTATASAAGTQASASASATLRVVQLSTNKCCEITGGNKGVFRITLTNAPSSPAITVAIFDNIFIPGGITVIFNDFGGCLATFANTGNPVPTNTEITGPIRIRIDCNNVQISEGSSAHRNIAFTLVSSSIFGTATIENAVETVTPVNVNEQIFLGAGTLPAIANVNVVLTADCTSPCV